MFYKKENDQLSMSPLIQFPNGDCLILELKDTYEYPIEGWYYFETEEEAKSFFNIND